MGFWGFGVSHPPVDFGILLRLRWQKAQHSTCCTPWPSISASRHRQQPVWTDSASIRTLAKELVQWPSSRGSVGNIHEDGRQGCEADIFRTGRPWWMWQQVNHILNAEIGRDVLSKRPRSETKSQDNNCQPQVSDEYSKRSSDRSGSRA